LAEVDDSATNRPNRPSAERSVLADALDQAGFRDAQDPAGDLKPGDFVKVECGACGHVGLLAPQFLVNIGAQSHEPRARPPSARALPQL
jgi:hypothetical protein